MVPGVDFGRFLETMRGPPGYRWRSTARRGRSLPMLRWSVRGFRTDSLLGDLETFHEIWKVL